MARGGGADAAAGRRRDTVASGRLRPPGRRSDTDPTCTAASPPPGGPDTAGRSQRPAVRGCSVDTAARLLHSTAASSPPATAPKQPLPRRQRLDGWELITADSWLNLQYMDAVHGCSAGEFEFRVNASGTEDAISIQPTTWLLRQADSNTDSSSNLPHGPASILISVFTGENTEVKK